MYFLTTIEDMDENGNSYGDNRTVGFFETFEEAEGIVLENACDIWETIYNYAVIEKLNPTLYPDCQARVVYQWQDGKYILLSKTIDAAELQECYARVG